MLPFRLRSTPRARVPHGPAMAGPMNEVADPADADLFGAEAIVHGANALAQPVQNPGGPQHRGAGFRGIFITGHAPSSFVGKLGRKPLSGGMYVQLMEQRPSYRAGFALYIA